MTSVSGKRSLIVERKIFYVKIFISALSSRYHTMIAPYVTQSTGDKMYFGDTAMFSIEAFNDTWLQLGDFARQRQQFILQTLTQAP